MQTTKQKKTTQMRKTKSIKTVTPTFCVLHKFPNAFTATSTVVTKQAKQIKICAEC